MIRGFQRESLMKIEEIRLLFADDNDLNLEILIDQLKESGFENIQGFGGGTEILAYMQENPNDFDIVLLDQMMPDMEGDQVIQEMKKHKDLKHVPAIIITNDESGDAEKKSGDAGAFAFFHKSCDHEELVKKILEAASKEI